MTPSDKTTKPRIASKNRGLWQRIKGDKGTTTELVAPRMAPADLSRIELDSAQLLKRPPRGIDLHAAKELLSGRHVLITGAGGTIGSELARQVASYHPSNITIVDNSEFNLYQIDLELREMNLGIPVHARLVDVCQSLQIRNLFEEEQPDIVLHAAAFKHVPIVEQNRAVAALTNVLGAKNVFDAAIEVKSEAVVFISTDKAVNPTSFMGATKRVAELYAQAMDISQTETRFVTVRFGNVLGSTGSVAPLFQRQIAKGGPITVTHPDISRFFMTTREAVQLVLQAASLNKQEKGPLRHDGRIFVLDMGDPIKIVDLAERMIEAAGLRPQEDIKIEFSGLRPGEKLFEEIFLDTEKLIKTGADGVLLASPVMIDLPLLNPRLEDVIRHAKAFEEDALAISVSHLVPEFRPDKPHKMDEAERSASHGAAE